MIDKRCLKFDKVRGFMARTLVSKHLLLSEQCAVFTSMCSERASCQMCTCRSTRTRRTEGHIRWEHKTCAWTACLLHLHYFVADWLICMNRKIGDFEARDNAFADSVERVVQRSGRCGKLHMRTCLVCPGSGRTKCRTGLSAVGAARADNKGRLLNATGCSDVEQYSTVL